MDCAVSWKRVKRRSTEYSNARPDWGQPGWALGDISLVPTQDRIHPTYGEKLLQKTPQNSISVDSRPYIAAIDPLGIFVIEVSAVT